MKIHRVVLLLAVFALVLSMTASVPHVWALTNSQVQIQKLTTTGGGVLAPESQQHVFRSTRGHQDYYEFSREDSGANTWCEYAWSGDGTTWHVNNTITSLASLYTSCSVDYFDFAAQNEEVVYFVGSRQAASAGTARDIVFRVGTIADSADTVTWAGSLQTIRASGATENQMYPVVIRTTGPNVLHPGFVHVAFDLTATNYQDVIECATTTANPVTTTSLVWNCSGTGSAGNILFAPASNSASNVVSAYAPQIQTGLLNHDVMVILNPCDTGSISINSCTSGTAPRQENATVVDWDGTTRTFPSTASFTYPASGCSSPADERSSTYNWTSGRVFYQYKNATSGTCTGGGWIVIRTLPSPYTTWSGLTRVSDNTVNSGNRLTITHGDKEMLLSWWGKQLTSDATTDNWRILSANATAADATTWSAAMADNINATVGSNWPNTPYVQNVSALTFTARYVPVIFTNRPATQELWITLHTIGIVLTRSFTASLTLASSSSRLVSAFRSLTANLQLSSSVSRLVSASRSLLGTLSFASSQSRGNGIFRVITDTLGLASTSSRSVSVFRTSTGSLSLASSQVSGFFRTINLNGALGLLSNLAKQLSNFGTVISVIPTSLILWFFTTGAGLLLLFVFNIRTNPSPRRLQLTMSFQLLFSIISLLVALAPEEYRTQWSSGVVTQTLYYPNFSSLGDFATYIALFSLIFVIVTSFQLMFVWPRRQQ